MSALKESSKDGGDREGHGLPEFRQKEDKGDRRGLGCRLRDVGGSGGRASSRRRHQEGFMEWVAYSWVLYPGDRTGQEAFQAEGAL